MRRSYAPLIVFCTLASWETRAEAYCRTSACQAPDGSAYTGKRCVPGEADDCGLEIGWRQPCISFDVQKDASSQITYDEADLALKEAFAAWTGAACGAASPSISVYDFGVVDCGNVEYSYDRRSGNANILVFRDATWPHDAGAGDGSADIIALTTVTFDRKSGDIFDADIEVNSANFKLTASNTTTEIDLQSVLTHEAGHFLGLAHTADISATMYPNYSAGTIDKRTPKTDDVAAICAAYPPDRKLTEACTAIPRHGWASQCAGSQPQASCQAAASDPTGTSFGAACGIGLLALARAARDGRRRARTRPQRS